MDSDYVHDCTVHSSVEIDVMAPENSQPLCSHDYFADFPDRHFQCMAVSETDALRMARDFVLHALEVTGMSSYALAREAGVSCTPPLTRLVNGSAKKILPP